MLAWCVGSDLFLVRPVSFFQIIHRAIPSAPPAMARQSFVMQESELGKGLEVYDCEKSH